nr:hypothetical protein GCM10020063_030290 [Dactylosporangium thailandense]
MSENPETGTRRRVPLDWIAVAVAAAVAALAAARLLPDIPWDSVTVPLIK